MAATDHFHEKSSRFFYVGYGETDVLYATESGKSKLPPFIAAFVHHAYFWFVQAVRSDS
jgi:hypothetical protein